MEDPSGHLYHFDMSATDCLLLRIVQFKGFLLHSGANVISFQYRLLQILNFDVKMLGRAVSAAQLASRP
jgi:hypothetical protein